MLLTALNPLWNQAIQRTTCAYARQTGNNFRHTSSKRRRKHEAKSTIKPTSEAWIQADGLHDHLLLKVGKKLNEVAVFFPKGIYPKGGMLNTACGKSAVIKI